MCGATAVKDHLYKLLNDATDVESTIQACETINTVLSHTLGFWQELSYCYKGAEIACQARKALEHFMETCQHHNTHKMLKRHADTLYKLEDVYYKQQQLQMMST